MHRGSISVAMGEWSSRRVQTPLCCYFRDTHIPAGNSLFYVSLISSLGSQNALALLYSLHLEGVEDVYIFPKEIILRAWTFECLTLERLKNGTQASIIKYQKLATL